MPLPSEIDNDYDVSISDGDVSGMPSTASRYSTTSHLVFDAGVANPHHTVPSFTCSLLCSFTLSIHAVTFVWALATAAPTTAQLRAEYFDN